MYKNGTLIKHVTVKLSHGEMVEMDFVIDEPKKEKCESSITFNWLIALASIAPIAIGFIDFLIK